MQTQGVRKMPHRRQQRRVFSDDGKQVSKIVSAGLQPLLHTTTSCTVLTLVASINIFFCTSTKVLLPQTIRYRNLHIPVYTECPIYGIECI